MRLEFSNVNAHTYRVVFYSNRWVRVILDIKGSNLNIMFKISHKYTKFDQQRFLIIRKQNNENWCYWIFNYLFNIFLFFHIN